VQSSGRRRRRRRRRRRFSYAAYVTGAAGASDFDVFTAFAAFAIIVDIGVVEGGGPSYGASYGKTAVAPRGYEIH